LPDAIGDLSSLVYLDLRGNRLTELPLSMSRLTHLEKLDLRWNPLDGIPGWFGTLEARGCSIYT
jgi:Leucine-rich repeat (LRR) protein